MSFPRRSGGRRKSSRRGHRYCGSSTPPRCQTGGVTGRIMCRQGQGLALSPKLYMGLISPPGFPVDLRLRPEVDRFTALNLYGVASRGLHRLPRRTPDTFRGRDEGTRHRPLDDCRRSPRRRRRRAAVDCDAAHVDTVSSRTTDLNHLQRPDRRQSGSGYRQPVAMGAVPGRVSDMRRHVLELQPPCEPRDPTGKSWSTSESGRDICLSLGSIGMDAWSSTTYPSTACQWWRTNRPIRVRIASTPPPPRQAPSGYPAAASCATSWRSPAPGRVVPKQLVHRDQLGSERVEDLLLARAVLVREDVVLPGLEPEVQVLDQRVFSAARDG